MIVCMREVGREEERKIMIDISKIMIDISKVEMRGRESRAFWLLVWPRLFLSSSNGTVV